MKKLGEFPTHPAHSQQATCQIFLDDQNPLGASAYIRNKLQAYNSTFVGSYERRNFAIFAKDQANVIIGGAAGYIFVNYDCHIDYLVVDEKYRQHGLGSALLTELENYVKAHNCTNIMLETAEFQAKDFYIKHGYISIATVERGFLGRTMYILRKVIS